MDTYIIEIEMVTKAMFCVPVAVPFEDAVDFVERGALTATEIEREVVVAVDTREVE